MYKSGCIATVLATFAVSLFAQQKATIFSLASPDNKVVVIVNVGQVISWSVNHQADSIITPSPISLQLENGEILGAAPIIVSTKRETINESFKANFYKKAMVNNYCNQLTINCKAGYGLVFRAYNDGMAYRFFTTRKDSLLINNEQAVFNFEKDAVCYLPFVRDLRGSEQFVQSYEALYDEIPVSKMVKDSLAFLPILATAGHGKKAVILEADVEDYPGMFVTSGNRGVKGLFAQYPLTVFQGGYNKLNTMVGKRAGFIAKTNGTRMFPWRTVVISENDKDLLNNDMIQKLSPPSRIADVSWIKPGKVAWDWWNDWNITHVDFKAGINTPTYKYYIDFAAKNHLEYIILDEGWSDDMDLMKPTAVVNVPELVAYGKQKNVGIILWASWYAVDQKMDEAFRHYSAMGIKGFKVDFMDRDDQKMVASLYEISKNASEYKLLLDFHGTYKPTGLQKTFPNVLNFEGVKGLENSKWTPADDVPHYDVTIPFIRMVAGPMDYTPGAMRNATKSYFRPNNSLPMSQGTRCHQLAMYVVFEAPLQMLADNPTAYMKEQECTDFIAQIPTTFDETVALSGKVGAHVMLARKNRSTWYAGAMGSWDAQDLVFDCSFLGPGTYEAEIFMDGVNADRDATDYKKEVIAVSATDKLKVHLSNGGGWAARIYKK